MKWLINKASLTPSVEQLLRHQRLIFESTVGAYHFIEYVERLYVGWEENHHAFAMQQNST